MDLTENLQIPYILPSQAQKHVTHNEAIKALDAVVQLAVVTRALATPPATPAAGARYIVPAAATGEWAGKDGMVAAWQDEAWSLHAPRDGWIAYALDENNLRCRRPVSVRHFARPIPERNREYPSAWRGRLNMCLQSLNLFYRLA